MTNALYALWLIHIFNRNRLVFISRLSDLWSLNHVKLKKIEYQWLLFSMYQLFLFDFLHPYLSFSFVSYSDSSASHKEISLETH